MKSSDNKKRDGDCDIPVRLMATAFSNLGRNLFPFYAGRNGRVP